MGDPGRYEVLREQFGHKVLDLLLTAIAFLTAYFVCWHGVFGSYEPLDSAHFAFIFLSTMVCCGLAFDFCDCYELHGRQTFDRVFLRIAKSVLAGTAGVVLLLYLLQMAGGSRLLMGLFAAFALMFLTACRAIIHLRRKRGLNRKEILIIGSRARARELIRYVLANEELGYHIIGCLEVNRGSVGENVADGVSVIGLMDDFRSVLLTRAVDEVIFAIPLAKVEKILDYLVFAEEQGVNVRVLPDWQVPELMYQPKVASIFIEQFVGIPMLMLSSTPRKELALLIKSVVDRILSVLGVVSLAPLFLFIALLIKVSSPGPVFFRQVRCGLNGRTFTLLKFRTMVLEAETLRLQLATANEMDGPVFKIKEDPRVTLVGRFLRKTSLDELPQLINVLRGEMSLVGPRPPLPSEVKDYKHWQRRRLSMKPGLTCTWQVSGRNDIRFEDWMRMDLEYIDRWSLLLDLKLMLKTVPAVIFGTGR